MINTYTKTSFKIDDSISKMSNITPGPQNKPKKKSMIFRKNKNQFQTQIPKTKLNLLHPKTPLINFSKNNYEEIESKDLKTFFAQSIETNDKSEKSLKNASVSKKSSSEDLLIKDQKENGQNELVLSMFDEQSTDSNRSSKQLMNSKNCNQSLNSSIVKTANLSNIKEGPFQALQRMLEKKKEAKLRQRSSTSSLKDLSKKLILQINQKHKFDENDLLIRSRYHSCAHERTKNSPFKPEFLNRSSIQKSHQTINRRSMTMANQRESKQHRIFQQSYQKCRNLISQCKQAQNQQRIKKQMGMFTLYSSQFSKKCVRKQQHFRTIQKMEQDKPDNKIGYRKFVFDPFI